MAVNCPKCRAENPETSRFCADCGTQLGEQKPESQTKTLQTPISELATGTVFANRYQIIEELGKGGMGKVYKVFDQEIRAKMALKLIRPEVAAGHTTIERFRNELKLARDISHKNICRMYDLGREAGDYFITMEYVSGEDLKSFIRRSKQLVVGTAVMIAKQVCEGLAEAHRLGVVHRDLKPGNIMIDKDGNVRIMDFGIAQSVAAKGITGAGMMIGTPEYMSPEQVEGKEVDQRSDIYSLGIILYEMLTGQVPFEGETPFAIGMKHKSEVPKDPQELNAQIPNGLNRLILKCLEKDKEKRYRSADELRADLEKIEKSVPTSERLVPRRKTVTPKPITITIARKKLFIPAVIVAMIAVAAAAWFLLLHKRGPLLPEEKRSIAVISFENQTGDEAYDYLSRAIPDILSARLEQSGLMMVTTWDRLQDLLKQAKKPDVQFIDKNLGLELCRLDGAEVLAQGSFIKTGEMFAINVRLFDAAADRLLKTASSSGQGETSILKTQIDELSREIYRGIGISDRRVSVDTGKAAEMTTSSPQAYKFYLMGKESLKRFDNSSARRYLEKAVEIDPRFALAYHSLYLATRSRGAEARRALDKAREYSKNLGEKDRLHIEASYFSGYTPGSQGDPVRLEQIYTEIARKYPKDKEAFIRLGLIFATRGEKKRGAEFLERAVALDPYDSEAVNELGTCYQAMGRPEKGGALLREYISRVPDDPNRANAMDTLAGVYFLMGQIDQAIATWKDAIAVSPAQSVSLYALAYAYGLREDYPEAIRWIDRCAPSARASAYLYKGFFDYWLGHMAKALIDLDEAKKLLAEKTSVFGTPESRYLMGWICCDAGDVETGRRYFQEMAELIKNIQQGGTPLRENESLKDLGLVFADIKEGKFESAKSRLETMRQSYDEMTDERRKKTYLRQWALLSAEIMLQEGNPQEAIKLLEQTPPFEMMWLWYPTFLRRWHTPHLQDVRARAYIQTGNINKAVAEYEKLVTFDPRKNELSLIHPLYRYRLAKLYEQKGLKDKAISQYLRFLDLWKDADPDRPEPADARKRVLELRENAAK